MGKLMEVQERMSEREIQIYVQNSTWNVRPSWSVAVGDDQSTKRKSNQLGRKKEKGKKLACEFCEQQTVGPIAFDALATSR